MIRNFYKKISLFTSTRNLIHTLTSIGLTIIPRSKILTSLLPEPYNLDDYSSVLDLGTTSSFITESKVPKEKEGRCFFMSVHDVLFQNRFLYDGCTTIRVF